MSALLLEADGLTKIFGSGRVTVRAVDDVTFSVAAGEVVLIMGPSGSGKTTLLSMVGGLLRPTQGRIAISGVEIAELRRGELARLRRESIGFVFQSFNLFESLSAIENVEIALNVTGVKGAEAERRARRLLVDAGLEGRLDFRSAALSAGERQRVAVARALANDPRLLLADEPTANLDSEHGHAVMELLRDLTKRDGRAAVVVSHDARLEEIADRLLWLEDGRIGGPAAVRP
jgi:putative ABC transport system ATP-binding protein